MSEVDRQLLAKRALAELRQLKTRVAELEAAGGEPVAVVGLSCRLPGGADGPEALWELLRRGGDAVTEVPLERWDAAAYHDPDPDAAGKIVTRQGAFIEGLDRFDPALFGLSPPEATAMDPQQRLLLEVSWEALERAGQAPDALRDRAVGVFIGAMTDDYQKLKEAERGAAGMTAYDLTGAGHAILAGRVSYTLGLRGPAMTVETACSSALVATHLACGSLRGHECDLALVGGVHVILDPGVSVSLSRAGVLAPDGRCKTFSAAANGYGRGEGCAVVLLKRLADAQRDGDAIWAVLRGSAVNHDGRSSAFTAPSGTSQCALLRQALDAAGVTPGQVSYLEAHGTGTVLGDPIELRALAEVFGAGRDPARRLAIGSIKTNMGHLEPVAGLAGLLKVVLALRHEAIPPHLHLEQLNPHVDLAALPVAIPTQAVPWPRGNTPRVAGVSSFGLSGTNAHLVVEEAPDQPETPGGDGPHLLTLSARTPEALAALTARLQPHLSAPEAPLADICYTLHSGRAKLRHRAALVFNGPEEACERLQELPSGRPGRYAVGEAPTGEPPQVALIFGSGGAPAPGQVRELLAVSPAFGELVSRCAARADAALERPLELLLQDDLTALSRRPDLTEPALFVLELGLFELWRTWGLEPEYVTGCGVGEYAAICAAGALSLEDALDLAIERGRMLRSLPARRGALVLALDEAAALELVQGAAGRAAIALVSGAGEVVLSGEAAALDEVVARSKARLVTRISPEHAPQIPDPSALDALLERAGKAQVTPPQLGIISGTTGRPVRPEELSVDYWRRQACEPARPGEAAGALTSTGAAVVVGLGPSALPLALARRGAGGAGAAGDWIPSLRADRPALEALLDGVGRLFVLGASVDLAALAGVERRRKVSLPTYPFERQRFWAAESGPEAGYYEVRWAPAPDVAPVEGNPGWWLLCGSGPEVGTLAATLEARGRRCVSLAANDDLARTAAAAVQAQAEAEERWEGVVFFAGSAEEPEEHCSRALALMQLVAGASTPPRLWIVTRGAQQVTTGEDPAIDAAPLWGLGRVFGLEQRAAWGGLVDLEPGAPADGEAPALADLLLAPNAEDQRALRGGELLVKRIASIDEAPAAAAQTMDADATFLITGGLGGVGLEIAGWLVERGVRHLCLMGRRGAIGAAVGRVAALEREGASVLVIQGDVSSRADVDRALEQIAGALPPLRGVIHAAGVTDAGPITELSPEALVRVLAPKVHGALNLHRALVGAATLEHFVLFSSQAALLGVAGQGAYVAANAFLDALAHHRRAKGLVAASINWGPWAEVGMTTEAGAAALVARWRASGVGLLSLSEVLDALGRLMASDLTQVGVMKVAWTRLQETFEAVGEQPLLREVATEDPGADAQAAGSKALDAFLDAAPTARDEVIVDYLTGMVAGQLGVEPTTLNHNEPLVASGLDSLAVVEMRGRIKAELGVKLKVGDLLEGATLSALARTTCAELAEVHGLSHTLTTGAAPDTGEAAIARAVLAKLDPEPILARLEDFTEQELDYLMSVLYAEE